MAKPSRPFPGPPPHRTPGLTPCLTPGRTSDPPPHPASPPAPTGADLTATLSGALQPLGAHVGWPGWQPQLLGQHSNHVLALPPSPWVARVPTGTARWRGHPGRVARELGVARHLADAGAPVIAPAPADVAGPHRLASGHLASLWQHVAVGPDRPDPAAAGAGLARCHRALAALAPHGPPGAGPDQGPQTALGELTQLLADPLVQAVAPARDRALVARHAAWAAERQRALGLPQQWLHGDAHLNNALQTPEGPVWADWEDTVRGALEDDLAALLAASRVLGDDGQWAEAAAAAWAHAMGRAADPEGLSLGIRVRTLFVIGWLWALGAVQGLAAPQPRLQGRLAWLRRQQAPGG